MSKYVALSPGTNLENTEYSSFVLKKKKTHLEKTFLKVFAFGDSVIPGPKNTLLLVGMRWPQWGFWLLYSLVNTR